MKKRLWILVGLVVAFISGFYFGKHSPVYRIRSTKEKFDLSADELTQLSKKAKEQGDGAMALALVDYYTFSYTGADREANIITYGRIAATNGNTSAQYNLAVTLIQQRDPSKYDEARFWLEKAAAAGVGDAKKGLENWDGFVRTWQNNRDSTLSSSPSPAQFPPASRRLITSEPRPQFPPPKNYHPDTHPMEELNRGTVSQSVASPIFIQFVLYRRS